jgi:uncharacterized protein YbjT (DUF2867 family)
MKVVIAGGSGLIGTALSKALLEVGHEPVILSRRAQPAATATPSGSDTTAIRHVAWDPSRGPSTPASG